MGELINGYKIISEFTNDNSGFARWAFAVKDGIEVFIKEFLSPVYPSDDAPISEEQKASKRNVCLQFEYRKRKLYEALVKSSTGNIVTVFDMFRYETKYYIVTQKINITNLKPQEVAALNNENKLMILKVLTHCVLTLHKNGIVHGDLKLDNILLKRTSKGFYTAKLIDFDSSFLEAEPPSDPDELCGDFVYFAPEAYLFIAGEETKLTTKIDVFALGIIFHLYYTGHLPEFSSEYNYLFEAVLDGAEVRLDNDLPEKIKEIISSMLNADQEQRPDLNAVFESLTRLDDIRACEGSESKKFVTGEWWKKPDDLL